MKGVGLYAGMHGFIVDEVELGTRVAKALDEESIDGWFVLVWRHPQHGNYPEFCKQCADAQTAPKEEPE